ncbi:hypothetical protein [Williamsia sp. 1138]|uniref:hypothetical protein n=1 Tax=Williamsia sp. 1138 TaxID=1903117 RepID=UPI001FEEC873|nr:hypothetical protein [Williamsia sp. 1138]
MAGVSELAQVPDDYSEVLEQLKTQVRSARVQATRTVNTQLLVLYWDIGWTMLDRQDARGWVAGSSIG